MYKNFPTINFIEWLSRKWFIAAIFDFRYQIKLEGSFALKEKMIDCLITGSKMYPTTGNYSNKIRNNMPLEMSI